jgi:hypothetical protein
MGNDLQDEQLLPFPAHAVQAELVHQAISPGGFEDQHN